MAGFIDVGKAMARAEELLNEQENITKEVASIRTVLRNAVVQKETTAEQTKWIKETFTEKKRRSKEERKAALEKQLADLK